MCLVTLLAPACGRVRYASLDVPRADDAWFASDAAADTLAPDATRPSDDAFVALDAHMPPDAWSAPDAGVAADTFVAPDAWRAADAFLAPDAFTSPDAWRAADAFLAPDTFMPPDAWRAPDAFLAPDAGTGCHSLVVNGQTVSFPSSVPITTGAFTFEVWVRTTQMTVSVIAAQASGYGLGFIFGLYNGRPFVQLRGVPNILASLTVNDGLFHHIALRRSDTGRISAYIDGTSVAVDYTMRMTDISASTPLVVGADPLTPGNAPYNGELSMLRMWGVERNDDELTGGRRRLLAPTPGLLLEAPFDEAPGATYVRETVSGTSVPLAVSAVRSSMCP